MPRYNVHSFLTVRVKVEGIEADSHKDAIATVENDHRLSREIAKMVFYDKPGEEISAIEMDEAPATAFIVDVCGDDDFENSLSFDVDDDGEPVPIGA